MTADAIAAFVGQATPNECACPVCQRPNNAVGAANGSDARPKPGDLTVCFGCGAFLTFEADLTQRQMSADELAALAPDERAALIRARQMCTQLKGPSLC